ncbi:hypothetical protein M407DRAFT_23029 [Tulasnella calospora MUT 4182]|uniref:Uncharacterized protein n=1 Tax=Tulasnella calospora MUT 4182 TaxID=1051891 RepID=A0A0C3QLW4_9AGAM|nr:hypothetical protein M407DRAFT_23029 [Tulasnella calospora MUT 4182]
MEPGAPPTFQSWTEYLVSTARFLSFLYSIPPSFADPGLSEVVERQYARLVKIACVYLTYRYTTSTISSFISSYPKATSAPTIASLVSTLGTTWLNAAVHSFDTQYELEESIPNVLSQSWARQRDGFQPKNDLPFFQLHDTARRWLAINPSSTLEQAILGFIGELEETWEPFETLTTYHEFSLIAAVFAITLSPNRETPDHQWVFVAETLIEALPPIPPPPTRVKTPVISHSTLHSPTQQPPLNTLIHPSQASPTSAVNGPCIPRKSGDDQPSTINPDNLQTPPSPSNQTEDAPPSRPQRIPPKSRTKNGGTWRAGDVIKFNIKGVSRKLKIRQLGAKAGNLVLTWLKKPEPVLAQDGSLVPLPPFDKAILVEAGPFMPALDLDCFIREQPLPPFLPFHEILSGMHDEYLRELFAKNPETPPASPEPEGDEIDDLPYELKVQALKDRVERRRRFRENLGLPPDPQDLADEANVASLLGSANREVHGRRPSTPNTSHPPADQGEAATRTSDDISTPCLSPQLQRQQVTPGGTEQHGMRDPAGEPSGGVLPIVVIAGEQMVEDSVAAGSVRFGSVPELVRDFRKSVCGSGSEPNQNRTGLEPVPNRFHVG